MADNTTLNTMTGGDVYRSIDRSGIKSTVVGLDLNPGGAESLMAGSLPVTQSGTWNVATVTTLTGITNAVAVTDNSGSLTVDNAGTFAVQDSQLVAGATAVAKAEDAASANADVGIPAMAIQKATPADTAGTDGDYAMLQMSAGRLWVDASGKTLTVGSHDVTNAGTFAVQAAQSGTWNVATVTTVSTITNVVHIDDNSGSITVDNAGTFAVQATIASGATSIAKAEDVASADADVGVPSMAVRKATPANTSGTDGDYEFLQMSAGRLWCSATIDAALPAGTNAIGKLAANSGVTIGAVEVAASQTIAVTNAGTFATQAAQSGTWNVGTVTTVSTITNVVHVDDNSGSLTVDNNGTFAVQAVCTNSGTFAVQADTELPAAAALADGVSNPTVPAVGSYNVTWNGSTWDRAKSINGHTYTALGNLTGNASVTSATNVFSVDFLGYNSVVVQVTSAGSSCTITYEGSNDNSTWVSIPMQDLTSSTTVPSTTSTTTGLIGCSCAFRYFRARVSTYGSGTVTAYYVGSATPLNPTAVAANLGGQTLANVTTVSTLTTLTGGGIAHDGVDSGNPIKTGARAVAALSTATMVAAADRTDNVGDVDGALITRSQFPLGDLLSEQTSNTNGTSTASSAFGATASTRNVITAIVVYNSSATAGYIDFRNGTAGSILYTLPLPAGGGCVLPAGATPYFRTDANTALAYDVSAALTTVYISVTGFKSKV